RMKHARFDLPYTTSTVTYTLSLHDALPICHVWTEGHVQPRSHRCCRNGVITTLQGGHSLTGERSLLALEARVLVVQMGAGKSERSEEHTSELQSLAYLVCRLLLENKNSRPV